MEALANDFESVETLVNYYAPPATSSFTQEEVMRSLVALMDARKVQCFLCSEDLQKYIPAEYSPSTSELFWFGLCPKKQ